MTEVSLEHGFLICKETVWIHVFISVVPPSYARFILLQEMEVAERLRVTKTSLEVTNEKLEAELEETKLRLREALSRPIPEGADSKTYKASVVTRSANGHAVHLSCFSVFRTNWKAFKAVMNWVSRRLNHHQMATISSRKNPVSITSFLLRLPQVAWEPWPRVPPLTEAPGYKYSLQSVCQWLFYFHPQNVWEQNEGAGEGALPEDLQSVWTQTTAEGGERARGQSSDKHPATWRSGTGWITLNLITVRSRLTHYFI